MSKTNFKQFSTAFPAIPSQDQFGRPVAIFPGMTMLDYFALTIYANNTEHLSPEESINFAHNLIQKLYEIQSESILEQNNTFTTV